MGKIDLKTLEVSGRLGPFVTYATKSGKQVYRKYIVPNDPKTPKQLAYRKRFSLVNSSLKPLCKIIKDGYKNKHNAYRSVVSMVLKNAVEGDYPSYSIDYSKIQIAEGELLLPDDITSNIDNEAGVLKLSWNTQSCKNSEFNKPDDRLKIICLDQSRQKAFVYDKSPRRSDGETVVDVIYPKDLHFWVYLTSADYMNNSESVYLNVNDEV